MDRGYFEYSLLGTMIEDEVTREKPGYVLAVFGAVCGSLSVEKWSISVDM